MSFLSAFQTGLQPCKTYSFHLQSLEFDSAEENLWSFPVVKTLPKFDVDILRQQNALTVKVIWMNQAEAEISSTQFKMGLTDNYRILLILKVLIYQFKRYLSCHFHQSQLSQQVTPEKIFSKAKNSNLALFIVTESILLGFFPILLSQTCINLEYAMID